MNKKKAKQIREFVAIMTAGQPPETVKKVERQFKKKYNKELKGGQKKSPQ